MKEKLIIILGPTACGKTDLSLQIAHKINGEIISGDSMQIYRQMDIGTAKIKKQEMQGIKHHLLDILSPDASFSAADFQAQARKLITEINQKGQVPMIVGGTGLYISAVIDSYLFKEEAGADDDFRHLKQKELQDQGEDALYQQLQTLDPLGAAKIHPHNHRRIIRALEIYEKTGLTISQYQAKSRQMAAPDYDLVMIGLKMSRDKLYERINQRVDIMLEEGLLAEVENLLQQGYDRDCNSMQGLGYRQMVAYYYGEATFAEAVYLLKRDTRHFAKRQLTWFRRDPRIIWFDKEDYPGGNKLAEAVIQRIEQVLGRIENEINRPARFLSE